MVATPPISVRVVHPTRIPPCATAPATSLDRFRVIALQIRRAPRCVIALRIRLVQRCATALRIRRARPFATVRRVVRRRLVRARFVVLARNAAIPARSLARLVPIAT